MTTDEAVLDYLEAADGLETLAGVVTTDGWTAWATEVLGYAAIARRAAEAEVEDPEPPERPCRLCRGVRACDIEFHRARRVIS